MITLRAKMDLPWADRKAGDTWEVHSVAGVERCMINLGHIEKAEKSEDKKKGAKKKVAATAPESD